MPDELDETIPASALRRITGLEPFPQPEMIPVQAPVVLMHGFGVGASFRRGGHLHEEALHLRSQGVRAVAPNVSPYDTVRARTATWNDRLQHVLDETGADRLLLIAHSMGGLDARYLISAMGWHEAVDALVTIATPHRGSSVASLVLDQPELVRDWLTDMADWVGTHILEDGSANIRKALTELTPEYMENTFNPDVPDHPDVEYWSYGCRAGKGTDIPIAPIFRYLNRRLYEEEGENDGIVSVESARWGHYQGTIDADHARQVGLSSGLAASFDSNAFYTTIVEKLAEDGW
ncbi:lipase family alpha/beta hydrolase [Salinibacter altiplanensis]|uniref:lipase family alpha/beta hydrolase n=1 Tax=Salinibacter altiplanensis TaxID=1803181 RepID=UPI001E48EEE2|nr:alpha/beta fold hydrolase [Salinibacter altiplanensis]